MKLDKPGISRSRCSQRSKASNQPIRPGLKLRLAAVFTNRHEPPANFWKGGRVVYGSSLENWRGRKLTVSSNLTPSASFSSRSRRDAHRNYSNYAGCWPKYRRTCGQYLGYTSLCPFGLSPTAVVTSRGECRLASQAAQRRCLSRKIYPIREITPRARCFTP